MNVTFWISYSKKKNSTARPSTAGIDIPCVLKEGTSAMEPTITITGHGVEGALFCDITYAFIPTFGRRYFVTDVKYVGPNTEVSLTCDTLGSFKELITASSQYVERAASATAPANVPDPLNPPTNKITSKSTLITTYTDNIVDYNGTFGWINSHFILGVVGKTGIEYWGLNATQLSLFFDAVFSLSFLEQFTSQFYDYRDCVVSLKRVTYVPSGDPGQHIYLGEHDTGAVGTALNSNPITQDSGLKLVAFSADDHLNIRNYPYFPPYTTGSLFLPMVGLVPLDTGAIMEDGKIGVKCYLDKFTADIVYKVYTSNDKIIGTYYGNCGADLPIAAQNYNPSNLIGGAIQTIGGIAAAVAGGPVGGLGVGAIGAGIGATAEGVKLHTQVNGCLSSFIGGNVGQAVMAYTYTNEPASWDIENMKLTQGVIVNEQKALSNLSGYVQCRNAHIAIPGSDRERNEIEALLNSGIFIE